MPPSKMQKRLMRTCAAIRKARDKKSQKKIPLGKPCPTPKEEECNIPKGAIVILCNPVLDVLLNIDPDILCEYEMGSKDKVEADERHAAFFENIHDMKPKPRYEGGGSGLNTARVIQAMIRKPYVTVYFGAIGKDESAGRLQDAIRGCGVNMSLEFFDDAPTATSAVLITGQNRAVLTNYGAARLLTSDFLNEFTNKEMLSDGQIYYITGYFLYLHPEKTVEVIQLAVENCKIVCFNFSAQSVAMKLGEQIDAILPQIDILFANEAEVVSFALYKNYECGTIEELAKNLQAEPKTSLKPRMVIISRGVKPLVVAYDGFVYTYPVKTIKKKEIVDKLCCGDAFVGGFLSQYIQNMPLHLCVRGGIWAAAYVLQTDGCNLRRLPSFKKSCK